MEYPLHLDILKHKRGKKTSATKQIFSVLEKKNAHHCRVREMGGTLIFCMRCFDFFNLFLYLFLSQVIIFLHDKKRV